jgi:drug/metabolite transporter (DMT)-like permease
MPNRATLIGLAAVVLWSLLAVTTMFNQRIPPFQLVAMSFFIGGVLGVAVIGLKQHGLLVCLRQPWRVWLISIGGLFGYHVLYFTALKWAPPAEANLINALWPLLIVLGSTFLLNEPLRARHIGGALLGLAGVIALTAGHIAFNNAHLAGYAVAFACALVWASYSLSLRFIRSVPTGTVAFCCLATALLSGGMHVGFEDTVWPLSIREGIAVAVMGIGPVGAAFYAWDYGMKHGDVRVLGAAAYLTPLMATFFLVLSGFTQAKASLAVACLLIVCGAAFASGAFTQKTQQI